MAMGQYGVCGNWTRANGLQGVAGMCSITSTWPCSAEQYVIDTADCALVTRHGRIGQDEKGQGRARQKRGTDNRAGQGRTA